MNDQEMLLLAAKAVGMPNERLRNSYDILRNDVVCVQRAWNPINDDGERYRLAKKLSIRIHFGSNYLTYAAGGICGVVSWPEDAADDAHAIVLAAARIGASL